MRRVKVYKFDIEGNLLDEYVSITECAQKNNISVLYALEKINKKALDRKGWFYLSKDEKFKTPFRQKNHNPLVSTTHFWDIGDGPEPEFND